jgi:basic membrane protein A and related proteins
MRRIVCAAVAFGFLAVLAGGAAGSASEPHGSPSSIAAHKFNACLVTDTGGIDDRSYNQLAWMGMVAAAAAEPNAASS